MQKSGNRLYKLGEFHLEVPVKVIDAIKEWNTLTSKNTAEYDLRFVRVLVLLCAQVSKVTKDEIMEFVRGMNFS